MLWFSSKPKKCRGKIERKGIINIDHANEATWCSQVTCSQFVHRMRFRIIWQTCQTLRIKSTLLEWKNKKQIQELCSDLDFQTDHLLPDSIITFCTPLMFLTWEKARPQLPELCALHFRNLTSHRVEIPKNCETGPHVYSPQKTIKTIKKRESLTICSCRNNGSTSFLSGGPAVISNSGLPRENPRAGPLGNKLQSKLLRLVSLRLPWLKRSGESRSRLSAKC